MFASERKLKHPTDWIHHNGTKLFSFRKLLSICLFFSLYDVQYSTHISHCSTRPMFYFFKCITVKEGINFFSRPLESNILSTKTTGSPELILLLLFISPFCALLGLFLRSNHVVMSQKEDMLVFVASPAFHIWSARVLCLCT